METEQTEGDGTKSLTSKDMQSGRGARMSSPWLSWMWPRVGQTDMRVCAVRPHSGSRRAVPGDASCAPEHTPQVFLLPTTLLCEGTWLG